MWHVPRSVLLVLVAGLTLACERRPDPGLAPELREVQAARQRLAAVRQELDGAAQPGAKPDPADEARSRFDQAFTDYHARLAAFLGRALTHSPSAPETREAALLYVDEAIANAEEIARRTGDSRKARDVLREAERVCRAASIPPPDRLAAALAATATFRARP